MGLAKDEACIVLRRAAPAGMGRLLAFVDDLGSGVSEGWRISTDDDDNDVVDYIRQKMMNQGTPLGPSFAAGGTRPRQLHSIDEASSSLGLRLEFDQLRYEMEAIKARLGTQVGNSASSASTLGHQVLDKAGAPVELVTITPKATEEASKWVSRAKEAGKKLESASLPGS